jgi:hypothetical protein
VYAVEHSYKEPTRRRGEEVRKRRGAKMEERVK